MAEAVTIRTLAKLAGVSTATVSLSLRNDPRIRPEVRRQIQQIAAEAGYMPNPVVANLIAQVRGSRNARRQGALGIVFTEENSACGLPAVKEWTAACEARANQLGYGFDRFISSRNKRYPEHLAKIIDARGIRGLIAVGPFADGVIPAKFGRIWQSTATIIIGARPIRPALSAVTDDHFSTAARAMLEVARLDYTRPGLCLQSGFDYRDEHRFIGGVAAEQVPSSPRDRIPPFSFRPDAEKIFRLWFKRHRPDVILTLHAEIRDWLEAMGLSAPADIGLVHLDRTAGLSGWAGMQQRHDQIGFAAVDMLIGQLQRNEFGPPPFQKCMFVYGTWLPGETVRNQARSAGRVRAGKVKCPIVDSPESEKCQIQAAA
jgi:LacI family transcriptional regulator